MQELFFPRRSGQADALLSTTPWARSDSAARGKGQLNLNTRREVKAGTAPCQCRRSSPCGSGNAAGLPAPAQTLPVDRAEFTPACSPSFALRGFGISASF